MIGFGTYLRDGVEDWIGEGLGILVFEEEVHEVEGRVG